MFNLTKKSGAGRVIPAMAVVLATFGVSGLAAQDFEWQGAVDRGDAITVRGINGDIIARRGGGREVSVEAFKTSEDDNPSDVRIEVIEDSQGVLICAVYPTPEGRSPNRCARGDDYRMNNRNFDVTVEFVVEVPAGVDLEAITVNGEIEAIGLSGDVRAVTVNGDVQVESEGVVSAVTVNGSIVADMGTAPSNDITFSTVNGGIRVTLPSGTDADVHFSTVNGHIESDFPITVRGRWGPRSASGELGRGGPQIKASTVNGSIELQRR